MDTNPVTNVDYFFQNTELFVSLNMHLPNTPNLGVPCLFYTDIDAYNQALEMADIPVVGQADPFVIRVIEQAHQVAFCLLYINPDQKSTLITACMTLWMQLEIHDTRFREINRLSEIRAITEFYCKLLLQFGIVL